MSGRNRRIASWMVRGIGLAAVLAVVGWAGAAQAQANECFEAENIVIVYWSSPAHTTIVGECETGPCPGAGCFGTKSSYVTGRTGPICEVCE